MTDILFITPTTQKNIARESVGTLLLATILRSNGLQADILQFYRFGDPDDFQDFLNNAVEIICAEQPKIVSFYTRCDNYHIMLRIAEALKKRLDVFIVFGGPQADICAVDTIREIPYVDFVCCGEGETTIYPFFSSLLNGSPNLSVPGLVYRVGDDVLQNPRPLLIEDLDTLPETDYSICGYDISAEDTDSFSINVGRGCPFGCTYCSTKNFWGRKYRIKSPHRIVSEIVSLHDRYGVSTFLFNHDMFTMNRKQVIETCNLLRSLDFPVHWECSSRIDCIDEELIDIMSKSGLQAIYIGIETGSERMQRLINKNLNLNGIVEKLAYIRSKNIEITTSFIYGFPDETEEDISLTTALIAEIAKFDGIKIQTHLCTFLPGTELSQKYLSQLAPAQSYSDITGTIAIEECSDLIDAHPNLFRHFLEYKTDLRTKLKYYPEFIYMWSLLQPIYQYIADKYSKDRLIDMYFDFADAERELLQQTESLNMPDRINILLEKGSFIKKFRNDDYYDIIADAHRMLAMQRSLSFRHVSRSTAVYCFSPQELKHCSCLREIRRRLTVATYSDNADGTLDVLLRSL